MATEVSAPPEVDVRTRNIVFGTIVLGMLLSALDQTIVSTSLPSIVADLGQPSHVSWVVTAYLLAETIATVVAGKLGDLFGRKVVFQASIAIFLIGSALSGVAQNLDWLVAARAVQGLGGGGLTVTATALIGDVIPLRERGRYQGALGAVFGVTTVLGPLLGGVFTDDLSWRWDFYVNVPIGIIVIALAARTIPTLARKDRPVFDRLGIATVAIGSAAVILGLSLGGTSYAWGSAPIIAMFVVGAAFLVAFVFVEQRAAEPILPMRLFRSQVFSVCCALSFVVGFAMLGSITFLPTFLQYVDGVSATASGARLLPLVAGLLLTTMTAGNLVSRTGRYKIFPVLGMPIMLVGFLLLSRLDENSSTLESSLFMVVVGLGIGLCMQVLTLVVQSTTDYADLGVATSGVTFMRTMGSSFGTAIFGALYANFLGHRLAAAIQQSPKVPAAAYKSPSLLHKVPKPDIVHVVHAYAASLDRVFLWAVPVAGLGLVLALILREVPLRGTERAGATDLGEAFAMPRSQDSEQRLEGMVAAVLREDRGRSFATILARADTGLDDGSLWGLLEVFLHRRYLGDTPLTMEAVARRHHLPASIIQPVFDRLANAGLVTIGDGEVWLAPPGEDRVQRYVGALKEWLVEKLTSGEDHPDTAAVATALDGVAERVVRETAAERRELVGSSS